MLRVLIVATTLFAITGAARAADDEDEDEDDPDDVSAPAKPADDADDAPVKKPAKQARDDADDAPAKSSKSAGGATASTVASGELIKAGGPKGRLTLPGGKFMLNVIGEANMAKGTAGKPLSVAPDLWIGVTDRLTFGIVHSGRGATGFLSGFGTGLCFRGGGSMGACGSGLGDVYTFASAEARIGLKEGGLALAFVLGGQARAFDPKLVASGKAGFVARLHGKRLALELAPMAYIGITQRKVGGVPFNQDEFGMPVTIFLRLTPALSFAVQGGITFPFKKAADNYRVPAAAGLAWWVSPHFSIDAAFGLAAVADKDDMTKAFDNRSATLGIGYAH